MKYMKKKSSLGCVAILCILLLNATEWEGSIWEGNAVVAAPGELPSEGMYVATNVFPRNTVVYITNLETEKTIPVTVAASLDNPGLLVTMTREAAQAIGMAQGSLGRIKMIQPADPEAFSKYLAQQAQNKPGAAEENAPPRNEAEKIAAETAPVERNAGERVAEAALPKNEAEKEATETTPAKNEAEKDAPDAVLPKNEAEKGITETAPAKNEAEKDAPDAVLPKNEAGVAETVPPEKPLVSATTLTPEEPTSEDTAERPNPASEPQPPKTVETEFPGIDRPEVTLFPEVGEEPGLTIREKPQERLERPETYWLGSISPTGSEPRAGRLESAVGGAGLAESAEVPSTEPDIPEVNPPESLPLNSADTELSIGEKPVMEDPPATGEIPLSRDLPAPAKEPSRRVQEKPPAAGPDVSKSAEALRYTGDAYSLKLTPAEERPPVERASATLPEDAEIAPIVSQASAPSGRGVDPRSIDPHFIIDTIPALGTVSPTERELAPLIPPIPPSVVPSPSRRELAPVIPSIPEVSGDSPPSIERELAPVIPGISKTAAPSPAERELVPVIPPIPQSRTDTPSTTATPHKFSVPVISRLEKGKYYLQLGAYHRAELVEPELSRIDSAYPLSVEHTGSPDRPLYRILLGPMNLGESGALLQRFRGIGYHDAFLRVGT